MLLYCIVLILPAIIGSKYLKLQFNSMLLLIVWAIVKLPIGCLPQWRSFILPFFDYWIAQSHYVKRQIVGHIHEYESFVGLFICSDCQTAAVDAVAAVYLSVDAFNVAPLQNKSATFQ